MTHRQVHWSQSELLAGHEVAEPLVVAGRRCHGGYLSDGSYVSPRTRGRVPAIANWQARHREDFGTEILDAPIATWPEPYPNVAQSKFLLRNGVREPVVAVLTRVGTVEGFGGLIRHVARPDLQRHFVESIDGTAAAHLAGGLFEAHARDEAGWEEESGHDHMWFAARDLAFENPLTHDETERMLERMGIPGAGGPAPSPAAIEGSLRALQQFPALDPWLESMLRRMISLLFIEISAFHTFAWAETVLSDTDLVAGAGRPAELVAHIRADETTHVDYLRTALTEMRDRTFVGADGVRLAGREVIGTLWDLAMAESLGTRRETFLRSARGEVEHAVARRRDGADLLAEFDALGTQAA